MILEALSEDFPVGVRRHVGVLVCGSVEGGAVVGRRLTTLHTKTRLTTNRRLGDAVQHESAVQGRGLDCAGWRPRGDP